MHTPRRHERSPLIADLTIQPGDHRPARFASKVFDVSKGGAAVFSDRCFPVGKLVGMEVTLPVPRAGKQKLLLYGVIRRAAVKCDGNVLGIEFVAGAADHGRLIRYLEARSAPARSRPGGGFTLVEAVIAMVIICVLVTLSIPIYGRAVEQARLDLAAGNLRAIWSGQRVYWLENRAFAPGLGTLQGLDLVDTAVARSQSAPSAAYVYAISFADADAFTAIAMRNGSGVWVGQVQIDETGQVTGAVTGPGGQALAPPS